MTVLRAFRFHHPLFDAPAAAGEAVGLALDVRGHADMVEGDLAIRQALLLLLSTTPGERVMRPRYGCELYRLTFAVNDATTEGLAMHYVRRAIETWEPRVELLRVDAQRAVERPGHLQIFVEYRVRRSQRVGELALGLSLFGEAEP